MTTRVGVDVGGTFTDMVFFDAATGRVEASKVPSTPHAPEQAVGDAFRGGVSARSAGSVEYFLHGTTVALNALIERKGATVGLLTTAGFRDILEIRRGERDSITNLHWQPTAVLVPRVRRREVAERTSSTGSIQTALVDADVVEACASFIAEGVEAIAVFFLNSYANPANELRAAELIRTSGFTGEVSLSHAVSGEYREYERCSTTVVDAYVRPRLSSYFRGVSEQLAATGFVGQKLVTTSGGGSVTFDEARERPFQTIQSGTVAGAVGAGKLCAELGIPLAVTADVGGTSFDSALIVDHQPRLKHEGRVLGMPIQTAWVDVRSIGAGGGSIAEVDAGGLLHVGPRSAGAVPGPVCYGHGGTAPTATDAAAALGLLGFGRLAGGFSLDLAAARAVMKQLGTEIDTGWDRAAHGVLSVLTANMAGLIREITAEYGQDVRLAQLLAFGGSGPLFATMIARELDVEGVVVPNFAGNFSAWALLSQDVVRMTSMTALLELSEGGLTAANCRLAEMFAALDKRSDELPDEQRDVAHRVEFDLRYAGQEFCVTVPAPVHHDQVSADPSILREAFDREYRRIFRTSLEHRVEITALRASAQTLLPRAHQTYAVDHSLASGGTTVDAYSFAGDRFIAFELRERAGLAPGDLITRPTILLEETTTTVIDSDFTAEVHPTGALLLKRI